MLKIDVTNIGKTMTAVRKDVDRFIDTLTETVYQDAKSLTPIDTGNARRNWQKEKRGGTTSVVNRVPYIEALERGHSKQAPNGILTPLARKTLRRYNK
ncbi:minor capsid protein [Phage DSL-LC06]|nr:minor capsid protein [Phage DSL-LC06]